MKAISKSAIKPESNMDADLLASGQNEDKRIPDSQVQDMRFRTKTFLKNIKDTTQFRMAWLHHHHPEWEIAEIIKDMSGWYAKEIPNDIVLELKRFMKAEWKKKSFREIDAASFDSLFKKSTQSALQSKNNITIA